ncbi:MAG: hypothetical protein PVG75_12345 [Thioalkalispiraceae bacterium]|jgi:hypothetical protein
MTESEKCDEKQGGCGGDPKDCQRDPEECRSEMNAKRAAGESMEDCLGRSLESLSSAFTSSARRWETIVYPSLFAFIILAAYGFYLIYNLTSDVSKVATYMETISTNMNNVAVNMHSVSRNMVVMTQTVDSQSASMKEMTLHMRHMSMSMGQMRYDLSIMNNSVSRPMSFMNTFMPW